MNAGSGTLEIRTTRLQKMLRAVLTDDSAQGLAEYAIIIALVAMVAVATLRTLGRRATNSLGSAANAFS